MFPAPQSNMHHGLIRYKLIDGSPVLAFLLLCSVDEGPDEARLLPQFFLPVGVSLGEVLQESGGAPSVSCDPDSPTPPKPRSCCGVGFGGIGCRVSFPADFAGPLRCPLLILPFPVV